MRMSRLLLILGGLIAFGAPAFLALTPTTWRIASLFILSLIIASGLHIVVGLARVVSLCHFSLVGVGAYTAGYLSLHQGMPPLLSIAIGIVATGSVALVVAWITQPLEEHYLTLATLAANEILVNIFRGATSFTGGVNGMIGVPPLSLWGRELLTPAIYYPVVAIAGLAVIYFVYRLESWQVGHAFRAMGDIGIQIESLGISHGRLRTFGFVLGGLIAGLAGGLMAHIDGFVGPESFGIGYSMLYLCFLVLFGVGHLRGVFITAGITVIGAEALRSLFAWQMVLVSAAAIVTLVARNTIRSARNVD